MHSSFHVNETFLRDTITGDSRGEHEAISKTSCVFLWAGRTVPAELLY